MQALKVIAFTYKNISLPELGRFFLDDAEHDNALKNLKYNAGLDELMYLSTCNRIEFIFATDQRLDKNFLEKFFVNFNHGNDVDFAVDHAQVYEGDQALKHLMQVAASLDSMVVGEREIITQVRNAYERCNKAGLTGDMIRLAIKNVIVTAKDVYTKTGIAEKPISVVSLAFRKLRSMSVKNDARFVIVGAGETNTNLLKYLAKHGYKNFTVFNRTFSKAQALAESVKSNGGEVQAWPMEWFSKTDMLTQHHTTGMDVLITCTSASDPLITEDVFRALSSENGHLHDRNAFPHESGKRTIVIDLAMPADVDEKVLSNFKVSYIGLDELREQAEKNLSERQKEVEAADAIVNAGVNEFNAQFRTRKVELKMQQVPEKIRAIRTKALNDVFADEIDSLDEESKELLNRVLDYMEKKYTSIPMVMAKEIILNTDLII